MSLISRRTIASSSRLLQSAAAAAASSTSPAPASASASGSESGSKERETANSIIQNVLAMYDKSTAAAAAGGASSNPFGGTASSASASAAGGAMDEGRMMLSSLPSGPSGPRPVFAAGESLPPHALSSPSILPTSRPPARPPLLGPSRSLAKQLDPFVQSGTRPLDHALNPAFAHQFVDRMGRIKGRNMTGLSWRSQRAVGKMVRRARAMGVVSGWSDRPAYGGYGEQ